MVAFRGREFSTDVVGLLPLGSGVDHDRISRQQSYDAHNFLPVMKRQTQQPQPVNLIVESLERQFNQAAKLTCIQALSMPILI
jgi:hypothetical protein